MCGAEAARPPRTCRPRGAASAPKASRCAPCYPAFPTPSRPGTLCCIPNAPCEAPCTLETCICHPMKRAPPQRRQWAPVRLAHITRPCNKYCRTYLVISQDSECSRVCDVPRRTMRRFSWRQPAPGLWAPQAPVVRYITVCLMNALILWANSVADCRAWCDAGGGLRL